MVLEIFFFYHSRIPHEIGDFVILLKSGLNYKQAALAQLVTAFAGIIGAIFALSWSSAERAGDATSWILPFTSGGFLYISMVNILPEIAREKNIHLCLKQILAILVGMFAIYVFNFLF
jgi:zinc transporter 13